MEGQIEIQKCSQLARSTPLCQRADNQIDHIIHLNEKKRADWIDPQLIITQQIVSHTMTINVAYLRTLDVIDKEVQETINEFQSFRRDRFLSDDIAQKNNRIRKTSDVDGLRQYRRNQAVIDKAMNRMNDSCCKKFNELASNSSKSFQLLTIINKKDDVEIISSAEDAQKIIDADENGDYEIQMIIDELPIDKGQTVIINDNNQLLHLITKIRNKNHQYSAQLPETLNFIKNYF